MAVYLYIGENLILTAHQFLFSKKTTVRIARHLAFWLIFSVHFFLWNLDINQPADFERSSLYIHSLINFLFELPVCIFSIYMSLYLIFPRYITTNKYRGAAFSLTLLNFLNILAACVLCLLYFKMVRHVDPDQVSFRTKMAFALNNGIWLPMTFTGFALGIKFIKNLYLKEKENEKLERQKKEIALNFLRSQIHPRFLFHSLETIYRCSIGNSAATPGLLLKLSDTLSYILYECNEKQILLEKELIMLKDYIGLEKMRFGNRLDTVMQVDIEGDLCDKYITPLFLMRFVESSFEQLEICAGTNLFLGVTATVVGNCLEFTVTNTIAPLAMPDPPKSPINLSHIENSYHPINLTETSDSNGQHTVKLTIALAHELETTYYSESRQLALHENE